MRQLSAPFRVLRARAPGIRPRARLGCFFAFIGLSTWSLPAQAWLVHEHARIAKAGFQRLDAVSSALIAGAWAYAREAPSARAPDGQPRLCVEPNLPAFLYRPSKDKDAFCVDLAALTGLAADHSCSPTDTLATVRSDFVGPVMKVAEQTELALRQGGSVEARLNVWHSQHIELQEADPQYLFRAQASGAHFQQPIQAQNPANVDVALAHYLARAISDNAELNAIGLYVNYHVAALQSAVRAVNGCLFNPPAGTFVCNDATPGARADRSAAFVEAISEEAFALHFLEDAFSSGHMLSPQGDDSKRMGTHDYYCEHGVFAELWSEPDAACLDCPAGRAYVAHGDGFLDEKVDVPRASYAVALSLRSLARALLPGSDVSALASPSPSADFDACRGTTIPSGLSSAIAVGWITQALPAVPRPTVAPPGTGAYYKEFGPFYMPNSTLTIRVDSRDFSGTSPDSFFSRIPGRLNMGLGLGYTAGGLTDTASDGVVWLTPTFNVDTRPPGSAYGSRVGMGVSLHMPYLVIPGDLIPLAAVALFDVDRYLKWAIKAAGGGLLGLQSKHRISGESYFQFVLGRELGFNYMPRPRNNNSSRPVVTLSGHPGYWQLVLPVVDFTALHVSDAHVALDTHWQLGGDLTRYYDDEGELGGARHQFYYGVFLSYGFQARRYPISIDDH